MNSLPFISHRLFVAAIGNEGRAQERPMRHERPSVEAAAPASVITFEVMDAQQPMPEGVARALRERITQVRVCARPPKLPRQMGRGLHGSSLAKNYCHGLCR